MTKILKKLAALLTAAAMTVILMPMTVQAAVQETSDSKGPTNADITGKIHAAAETDLTIQYEVNDPSMGTVHVNGIDGASSETVASGSKPAGATAVPNEGYVFVNWTLKGSNSPLSTDASFVPDGTGTGTVTYVANFQAPYAFFLYKVAYEGGGSVTRYTESCDPYTGHPQGSTAVPDAGYAFQYWQWGDTVCGTEPTFVPKKAPEGMYVTGVFYAHFAPSSGIGSEASTTATSQSGSAAADSKPDTWCITYLDCQGNTVSVQWVPTGGSPAKPAGYSYPEIGNVSAHQDIHPISCNAAVSSSGYTVPNTADRG